MKLVCDCGKVSNLPVRGLFVRAFHQHLNDDVFHLMQLINLMYDNSEIYEKATRRGRC